MMLMAAIAICAGAATLKYKFDYHWGFINKTAAHGTVTLDDDGDTFTATLNGHTIPWGGREYTVSDTLRMTATRGADGRDVFRETYRAGWYSKPLIAAIQDGSYKPLSPSNYKTISGHGTLSASPQTMEAISISVDMLAMYRIFHSIDFSSLTSGQTVTIPITMPDGSTSYSYVTYKGAASYEGTPSYEVEVLTTYRGSKSNYPVTCQISRDSCVILLMQASIAIGDIRMIIED